MAKHETTPIGDIPDEIVAQRSMKKIALDVKSELGFIDESVPKSPTEDRKLNTEAGIGKLESVLKSRNKELSDKIEMLIREKNDVFSAKENEIYWLRDELLTLTNQCGERDERIRGLLSEINSVKRLVLKVLVMDKVIEILKSVVSVQETILKMFKARVSVMNKDIESLESAVSSHQKAFSAIDKSMESFKLLVSRKDKVIESLKSTNSEKEKTIEDMKKKLLEQEKDLSRICHQRARFGDDGSEENSDLRGQSTLRFFRLPSGLSFFSA